MILTKSDLGLSIDNTGKDAQLHNYTQNTSPLARYAHTITPFSHPSLMEDMQIGRYTKKKTKQNKKRK